MIRSSRRRNRRVTGVRQRATRAGGQLRAALLRAWVPLLVFALSAGVPPLAWKTWSYLRTSPFFVLHNVTVKGNHHLDAAAVEGIARSVGGDNVLEVDPEAVTSALKETGWVRGARVRRVLPDTLEIHLAEHRPVATVMQDGWWLVDEAGRTFREVSPGEPLVRPVISGIGAPSSPYRRRLLGRALTLADLYRRAGLGEGFDPLAEIHFDPARGFSLVTERHRMIAHLGHGPDGLVEAVRRLRFVTWDAVERGLGVPAELHADLERGRVVVAPSGPYGGQTRVAAGPAPVAGAMLPRTSYPQPPRDAAGRATAGSPPTSPRGSSPGDAP